MAGNRCFVLVNECVNNALGKQLTPAIMMQAADAFESALNGQVGPEHGGEFVVRVGSANDIDPHEVPCITVDEFEDPIVKDVAAAYHDRASDGSPRVWVQMRDFNALLSFPGAWSVGMGHELDEAAVDPGCSYWSDRGDGTSEALETCDRLQGSCYQVGNVTLPDFLLASAFILGAPRPWTWVEKTTGNLVLASQFDHTPAGYAVMRGAGNVQIPSGQRVAMTLMGADGYKYWMNGDAAKITGYSTRKLHPFSRTHRRGLHSFSVPAQL